MTPVQRQSPFVSQSSAPKGRQRSKFSKFFWHRKPRASLDTDQPLFFSACLLAQTKASLLGMDLLRSVSRPHSAASGPVCHRGGARKITRSISCG